MAIRRSVVRFMGGLFDLPNRSGGVVAGIWRAFRRGVVTGGRWWLGEDDLADLARAAHEQRWAAADQSPGTCLMIDLCHAGVTGRGPPDATSHLDELALLYQGRERHEFARLLASRFGELEDTDLDGLQLGGLDSVASTGMSGYGR